MAQTRLLKDILFLFTAGLLIYMSIRTYQVYKETSSPSIQKGVVSTGLDNELMDAVESMDQALSDRKGYTYSQSKDPMDATKIIIFDLSDLYDMAELQARNKIMRLSCTIVDENPSAVIKYRGKSHVLHIGEKIGNKTVMEITQKMVRFDNGEILYNKKAPTLKELMSNG
ncbi:MAG: hypothetical protein B6244_09145 [Candidatus Cloacimonetes bacterium 4572_55]|nr:MAG: hypothetical protein B6244_09145 [Candidatus Cloacimonetes bacterium 4572_55]